MKYLFKLYYYFLFLIKDPKKLIKHPRFDKAIVYGFTVGNVPYYRLKNDYEIYENRFRYLKTFYQEVENKLASEDINEFGAATKKYIEDYKLSLHKGEPKPELLDKAKELQDELVYRSTWLFEPTSLFKYASVIYFDLAEDIREYDMEYCHKKIVFWSKKKTLLRLILKELMSGVDNLLALSNEDFQTYLSQINRSKELQQQLVSESGLSPIKQKIEVQI